MISNAAMKYNYGLLMQHMSIVLDDIGPLPSKLAIYLEI